MSDLNNIVQVTISRETQSISQAGFGVPAIIAEFATSKTTPAFDRYREYANITEMGTEGWAIGDAVYDAAVLIFSQNPKVEKIMVGRKDSADASWSAALTAIQVESQDWYTFTGIASQTSTVVFSADLITGNLIDFTINGTAVTQVPWASSHNDTMDDIVTQIEADITNSSVTLTDVGGDNRTLKIEIFGDTGVESASVVVTGGASQATGTVTYDIKDDIKAMAAWAETQTKLFFYSASDSEIKNPSSTDDLAYFMKNTGYDRTISLYHTNAQGDAAPAWMETAVVGEALPYDPGSQTWAYKTLAGVAAYGLTSGERTAILDKNCGIYTTTAGVNVTEEGKVASGEYIDIMRGIDWLTARLQEAVFTELVNKRKIPFTDEGIQLIEGAVKGVLSEAATAGLLIEDSIVVTVPKAADVSTANKLIRNLVDVEFEALLQGAIHTVEINGVVTV
jgi:hypothetical protein